MFNMSCTSVFLCYCFDTFLTYDIGTWRNAKFSYREVHQASYYTWYTLKISIMLQNYADTIKFTVKLAQF